MNRSAGFSKVRPNYSHIKRDLSELLLEPDDTLGEVLGFLSEPILSTTLVDALETSADDLLIHLDDVFLLVVVLGGQSESILLDPGDEGGRVDCDVAFGVDGEERGDGYRRRE